MLRRTPFTILFPYTTLFRSLGPPRGVPAQHAHLTALLVDRQQRRQIRAGSLLSGGHGLLDRLGAVPDRQQEEPAGVVLAQQLGGDGRARADCTENDPKT